jgi:hypothetical protein
MSTSIATKTQYTPEDLLSLPDSKSYELHRDATASFAPVKAFGHSAIRFSPCLISQSSPY